MSTEDKHLNHDESEIDPVTKDRYLGGHEYDGIRELDNKMPVWWLVLFYGSILFSIIYMVGYHVTEWWPLQDEEYAIEMAAVASVMPADPHASIDLAALMPMTAENELAAGEVIFAKLCATCHGKYAEGLVGPNMTDMFWIHGDTTSDAIRVKDLYQVMLTGVIEKGMISYKDQLSPTEMQQVIGFIFSLEGTNPPKPKAAEGHEYKVIG